MPRPLPFFAYFPDPLGNGCVTPSGASCPCCGEAGGHMYVGPIYGAEEIEHVCPWCIADGRAHAAWNASFNDVRTAPEGVPKEVVETIGTRTPGFATWQGNE